MRTRNYNSPSSGGVRPTQARRAVRTPLALAFAPLIALAGIARAADAQDGPPQAVPAPATGGPPTGLQFPLPAPAAELPTGEHAREFSLSAAAIKARYGDKPLTMDDVVSIALAVNPDLATAVEALSSAQGQTVTSRASLGPTLSTGYTLDRYNQAEVANVGGQSITIQNQYINQGTATFSLPIDIVGEIHAAVAEAQFQEIAARLDVNRVRNEVVLNVKTAFYNVLRDRALVDVAKNDLQNTVDRQADAQLRLAAGTVARYDVLSAQSDVATARKTLIQDQTTLSQALLTLNQKAGIEIDARLQLTTAGSVETPADQPSTLQDPPPHSAAAAENALTGKEGQSLGDSGAERASQVSAFVVSDPLSPGNPADYDRLREEALRTRAEILREDADIAAAKKGIVVARQGLLPSMSVGYTYSLNPDASSFGGQKQTGEATLAITIPLFDSGAARGKVRTARAAVATAETNRRTAADTVVMEVRQAYLNLQQSQEEVAATRKALALADEAYRLARLRYSAGVTKQSGVSPIIELSDAQKSLSQAQSDYVNALYDYNNYRSSLDKAVGRYSYTAGGPGYSSAAQTK